MLTFSKINFQKIISEHYQSVNQLNPDQDRHYVCPDQGPNCLQWLSADNESRP